MDLEGLAGARRIRANVEHAANQPLEVRTVATATVDPSVAEQGRSSQRRIGVTADEQRHRHIRNG